MIFVGVYCESISTPSKPKNMPDHGGNRTSDIWNLEHWASIAYFSAYLAFGVGINSEYTTIYFSCHQNYVTC